MFYENYLNSIKPDMESLPESASFQDVNAFTQRGIQDAYNEAAISLVSKEVAIFTEATTFVNEAGGFLETIKNFFSTIWSKIKAFFSKILTMIKELFSKIQIGTGKVTFQDFQKALDKVKDDAEFKNVYSWAKAHSLDSDIHIVYQKVSKDSVNAIKSKEFTDEDQAVKDFQKDLDETVDDWKQKTKYKLEDWKDDLYTTKKRDIKNSERLIGAYVFKDSVWSKSISKQYKQAKRTIDEAMNELKREINATKEDDAKVKGLRAKLQMVKAYGNQITKITSYYNTMKRKIRSNYISLVAKIMVSTGTKPEAKNESYSYDIDYFSEADEEDLEIDATEEEISAEEAAIISALDFDF